VSELRPPALAALIAALDARGRTIGDWSVHSRQVERFELAAGGALRGVRRLDVGARVHVDGPTGRGSADLAIEGALAELDPAAIALRLDEAVARALVSIGPGWRAAPPAAPARVSLGDGRHLEPFAIVSALGTALDKAAEREKVSLVEAQAAVEHTTVLVETSRGLAARWTETLLSVDARIADGASTARLGAISRTLRAIDPAALVADAAARARLRTSAGALAAGSYPVLISAALLGGEGARILGALAALGDASLHRHGLARVAVGKRIAEGADVVEDPLSFASDGTLPDGVRSAPLADHGEPVRRFPIVERGVLVGVGLDEREAALRDVPANGGVRNLVISPGASGADTLRAAGALELLEIEDVDIEPLTGHGTIAIGLARLHAAGSSSIVSGAELQGDLVAAFARGRRSKETARVAAYAGPALVELIGLRAV
jgi:predicted Zn-dependent protease